MPDGVRIAHFVHRQPPAVGGAEAYFDRLGRHLAARGDRVEAWTSTAVDLEAMRRPGFAELPAGIDLLPPPPLWARAGVGGPRLPAIGEWSGGEPFTPHPSPPPQGGSGQEVYAAWLAKGIEGERVGGTYTVRRYRPLRFPGRRYVLKAASLVPIAPLQAATRPCNPVCPGMWADVRRAGPVDVVHATAFPYSFPILCGLRLARRWNAPFLLTPFLHLGDPADPHDRTRRQYTSRPLRWLLNRADRVFAQTPAEAAAIVGLGVSPEKVVVQGLGVDPAECTGGDRAAARRRWGAGDGDVAVGHLANLSPEKGTVDLLRATAGLPLTAVLAGPAMPAFERFWAASPGAGRVVRLGVLTDAQKRDFFAGVDVFALPSRTDSFGLVLLEAWANGVPVVCYRAGGPADLVRPGVDGLLARCGDIAELRSHLVTLAADVGMRRKLGSEGRERVARDFRWADKLELVRAAVQSIRGERGASASRVRGDNGG